MEKLDDTPVPGVIAAPNSLGKGKLDFMHWSCNFAPALVPVPFATA